MEVDVLIVDDGPTGLAAATRLCRKGIHNILIVEREKQLGGILRQCIHDGFGLARSRTTLSGPEYAQRSIDKVEESGIPYITDVTVLEVTEGGTVTAAICQGPKVWKARSVILTMEYRERTRGALGISGEQPADMFTTGVARAYINLCNVVPAKEVVILGSGDIDMVMARRLTLKGAYVQAVFEIQPYPSGLLHSIGQCPSDYGIPLYLSHVVVAVHGNGRLTGVTVPRMDGHLRPTPRIEKEYKCDTLILSVGLIPGNEPSLDTDVILDDRTEGAVVGEHFQTDAEGVLAAESVLHVHDLMDFVSMEAESLADLAVEYMQNGCPTPCPIKIETGSHINHTAPQRVGGARDFKLSLRINSPLKECSIEVRQDGVLVASEKVKKAIPAETIELTIKADKLMSLSWLEVSAEC